MKWVKDTIGYWCEDILSGECLGQGIGVAVMDTGIMLHPDFGNRIKGFADFVNGKTALYDDSGHGTHVAGILAGNGRMSGRLNYRGNLPAEEVLQKKYSGIAPRSELVIAKVLDQEGNGTVENVLRGIEWIQKIRQEKGVRIVNISVGAQPGLESAAQKRLLAGVESLWDAGLVVVVSAGNYGPGRGTVAVPGSSRKVITVGAEWIYSGCGPTDECVVKPDVTAPGTDIVSCSSGYTNRWKHPYVSKTGTSMATPIVSGAIACLLSKFPEMTNVEVKLKLRESSVPGKKESQGWGMLHVGKLLED
jgi:serine protease AprX